MVCNSSKKERVTGRKGLLWCVRRCMCVGGSVNVCTCVLMCVCARKGVHERSWSEAAVCSRVRGQINGTWKTKNTVRRCWHSYSSVNISQGYALIVSTQISSLTYKHTGPSMVQSNVWVIELCHCSFVIADASLHSLCARTKECPDLSCRRSQVRRKWKR